MQCGPCLPEKCLADLYGLMLQVRSLLAAKYPFVRFTFFALTTYLLQISGLKNGHPCSSVVDIERGIQKLQFWSLPAASSF